MRNRVWKRGSGLGVLLAALGIGACSAESARSVPPPPLSAVAEATRARCVAGDKSACATLGRMYLRGLGATRDLDAAEKTLQPACEAGSAEACADLGEVYVERGGEAGDLPRAVQLFRVACDRGSAKGCARLGRSLLYGVGIGPDQIRAVALLQQVCNRGEPEACLNLGGFYMGAGGARRDYMKAFRLIETAVAHGGGHGTLALMYWKGYGVERDGDRARELFVVGCEQGDAAACLNLGIMCQLGEGGPSDYSAAVASFRRACELGEKRGCAVEEE